MGRPTKYHKKYCNLIIKFLAKGYSKEAFAGEIGVSKQTIYTWTEANKEFSDAVEIAEAKSLLFWEKKGIEGMEKGKAFNALVWKFNIQNRFGWSEKQELDHTSKGIPIINPILGGLSLITTDIKQVNKTTS